MSSKKWSAPLPKHARVCDVPCTHTTLFNALQKLCSTRTRPRGGSRKAEWCARGEHNITCLHHHPTHQQPRWSHNPPPHPTSRHMSHDPPPMHATLVGTPRRRPIMQSHAPGLVELCETLIRPKLPVPVFDCLPSTLPKDFLMWIAERFPMVAGVLR